MFKTLPVPQRIQVLQKMQNEYTSKEAAEKLNIEWKYLHSLIAHARYHYNINLRFRLYSLESEKKFLEFAKQGKSVKELGFNWRMVKSLEKSTGVEITKKRQGLNVGSLNVTPELKDWLNSSRPKGVTMNEHIISILVDAMHDDTIG